MVISSMKNKVPDSTCPFYNNNTVELRHLLESYKKKKWICLYVIGAVAVLSIILAFTLPPSYNVELSLLPPEESSVNRLYVPGYYNAQVTGKWLFELKGEQFYFLFLDNLRSFELQSQFIKQGGFVDKFRPKYKEDSSDENIIEKEFSKKMDILYDGGLVGETKFITVELTGDDPEFVAELLNGYIHFVDSQTVAFVEDAMKAKVSVELKSIKEKISSSRKAGEEKRKNRIIETIEDLRIAEKLNIIEPADISFNSYSQNISSDIAVIESTNNTPGYLKGVSVLNAELNALQSRKNNDPFISGLSKLIEEREYLANLEISLDGVHAARIDKLAQAPLKEARPMKILVMAMGVFFGILCSIFIVLIDVLLNKSSKE